MWSDKYRNADGEFEFGVDGTSPAWVWVPNLPGFLGDRPVRRPMFYEFPMMIDWLVAPLCVVFRGIKNGRPGDIFVNLENAYQGRPMDTETPIPVAVMREGDECGDTDMNGRTKFGRVSMPDFGSPYISIEIIPFGSVKPMKSAVMVENWGLWSRPAALIDGDAFHGGDWHFFGSYEGSMKNAMLAAEDEDERMYRDHPRQ